MATTFAAPPSVRLMRTDDGAVLVSLGSNAYYRLNSGGLTIWEGLVERGLSAEQMARSIYRRHTVEEHEADELVAEFVTRLEREGLLVAE